MLSFTARELCKVWEIVFGVFTSGYRGVHGDYISEYVAQVAHSSIRAMRIKFLYKLIRAICHFILGTRAGEHEM